MSARQRSWLWNGPAGAVDGVVAAVASAGDGSSLHPRENERDEHG